MGILDRRAKLSEKLHEICENVYFEPPESQKLVFPAIVYNRMAVNTVRADNKLYLTYDRYQVTYIHKKADDTTVERILELPMTEEDREFKQNDMYHNVFTVYVQ